MPTFPPPPLKVGSRTGARTVDGGLPAALACLAGGSDRVLLPANGGFYSRAFDGSVTLSAAGYNYGGN
jgi:hypothetical protein